MNVFERFSGVAKVITVFVVLALALAVIIVFRADSTERHITVDFTRANSLYKGSDVRILGVPVGKVEKLEAKGNYVRATLSYEGDVRLPTDVKAVIISPAIVGDRFVQLAPAYTGAMQGNAPWLEQRRVFGDSGYPWAAPEYRARGGDPERRFACPNALAVLASDCNLSIHEGWGDQEVTDTLAAIAKVERAYLLPGA